MIAVVLDTTGAGAQAGGTEPMATIKDVAALAGISYTTVSHVLNKTRPVSEHVRLKVEAAIAELDYVPSAVARSLKARSTATIGLLVPNSVNPYFAELARGIEDGCERNGYCVILCNSDDNPQKQRSYLRVLLEKRIDGLIVASVGQDSDLLESLACVRTPMVIVDRALDGIDADRYASTTNRAATSPPGTCWTWATVTSPASAGRPTQGLPSYAWRATVGPWPSRAWRRVKIAFCTVTSAAPVATTPRCTCSTARGPRRSSPATT